MESRFRYDRMQQCGAVITVISVLFTGFLLVAKHIFSKEIIFLLCLGIGLLYIGDARKRDLTNEQIASEKKGSAVPVVISGVVCFALCTVISYFLLKLN